MVFRFVLEALLCLGPLLASRLLVTKRWPGTVRLNRLRIVFGSLVLAEVAAVSLLFINESGPTRNMLVMGWVLMVGLWCIFNAAKAVMHWRFARMFPEPAKAVEYSQTDLVRLLKDVTSCYAPLSMRVMRDPSSFYTVLLVRGRQLLATVRLKNGVTPLFERFGREFNPRAPWPAAMMITTVAIYCLDSKSDWVVVAVPADE